MYNISTYLKNRKRTRDEIVKASFDVSSKDSQKTNFRMLLFSFWFIYLDIIHFSTFPIFISTFQTCESC